MAGVPIFVPLLAGQEQEAVVPVTTGHQLSGFHLVPPWSATVRQLLNLGRPQPGNDYLSSTYKGTDCTT